MRVLVVGGTGFIGARVVRRLSDEGHEVTVFTRGRSRAALPQGVRGLLGEHRRLGEFRDEFRRLRPDVALNMILYTEAEAAAFVQTFAGIAARSVCVSSMDVYRAYGLFRRDESGPAAEPFDEDAPLRRDLYPYRGAAKGPQDWLYHYEKILVERVLMGVPELPCTVLRLAKVYGPGDRQHQLAPYLGRMDDGRPAILLDERKAAWRWTRVYVDDAAAGIALAVTRAEAAGRVYNLGEPEALTEARWVESIAEAAGWEGEVLAVPPELLPEHLREPYDWAHHLVADTSRIERELGHRPGIARREALRECVLWEREHRSAEIARAPEDYATEDAALERLRAGA